MPVNNGIITAPVSIEDVASCLGVGSYDLGTLCLSDKVNMWSRRKPVTTSSPDGNINNKYWWKGEDGKCGLLLPASTTSYKNIKGMMTANGMNGWGYKKPSGYYVLNHFDGYMHNAEPPISNFIVPDNVSEGGKAFAVANRGLATDDDSVPGPIEIGDISASLGVAFSQYYFGIAVYEGETYKGRVTGTAPGDLQCEYSVAQLYKDHTYDCYPFLSSKMLSQSGSDVQAEFYTIPNVFKSSFKIVSREEKAGLNVILYAKYMMDFDGVTKAGISVDIEIWTDSGSMTLTTNTLQARFIGNTENTTIQSGEMSKNIGTITATTTHQKMNYTFLSRDGYNKAKMYHVILMLNTAQFKFYGEVEEGFQPEG